MGRFRSQLVIVLLIAVLFAVYAVWLLATPGHEGKNREAVGLLIVAAVLGFGSLWALVGRRPS